jgi:hypothetical protein
MTQLLPLCIARAHRDNLNLAEGNGESGSFEDHGRHVRGLRDCDEGGSAGRAGGL